MHTLFLVILVLTSIVALTFIIERSIALRWNKVIPPGVRHAIEFYRSPQDLAQLQAACDKNPSTCGRLIRFAAQHLDWSRSENAELLETRARHEVAQLERGLVVLEIIVGIAPLLGLVGTIFGLIMLFGSTNPGAAIDNAKFAQGISLALYATLIGLLVAVPALIAWSYFSKKVENLAVELESICDEFLRKHYHSQMAESRQTA
jgi:biopolymer transport protein ExbB